MITKDPLGKLPDIVQTVSIHPLVVVPSSIRYNDRSRSPVQETAEGAVLTRSGRALRDVQLQGTFGVESRGLAIYIGTGDLRFQKFYHEVVRLPDALTQAQVDAEVDPIRSPFLKLALAGYQDEKTSFYVNWYDFWHGIEFECMCPSFTFTKQARQGAGAGATFYDVTFKEVGPIVTGGIGETLIDGLFAVLETWSGINTLIESYRPDAIEGALVATGGIAMAQFNRSLDALAGFGDGVVEVFGGNTSFSEMAAATGLLNGFNGQGGGGLRALGANDPAGLPPTELETSGLSAFTTHAAQLVSSGQDLIAALALQDSTDPTAPPGSIDWSSQVDEGSIAALDAADRIAELEEVVSAGAFQLSAGAYYGMSRAEFEALLSAAGARGADLAGTVPYTVGEADTPASLRARFGVDFEDLLRLNAMYPDEALLAGTTLLIPKQRQLGQQDRLTGLPVFGSHAGEAAWGSDMTGGLDVDANGRLVILRGAEVLEQGVDWIIEGISDELARLVAEVPANVADAYVGKRAASALREDRRIRGVSGVSVVQEGALVRVRVRADAINGGQINTAG